MAATDGGATFDALIAREAEIARREAEAVRNVKERISATTGVTGTRATDAGASFDALSRKAAHDEEAESVRKAAVAYERFEARCREGAKAMREAASAAERDANDVQHLRTILDPMAAIQANYNTQLARYRDLAAAGKITTEELAAAETHLAAQAQRSREALNHGRLGLFGLRPYELTNLSYQINDVVTGLASGQHLAQVEQAKHASTALNGSFLDGTVTYRGFLDSFASSAADAFTGFLRDVGAGENVFKSFGKAILSFAASFVGALAQMIIKCLAFTAALYALSAITGIPVQVLAAGASIGASVHHTGGIAGGAGGTKRSVAPMLFSAAMRYHTGGIAGLAPDQVPAILRVGEEVLTEGDPRHRANGGLGGGGSDSAGGNVTVIQVTDPAQALEQALRTPAGEKVFINHVRENKSAFKAALG